MKTNPGTEPISLLRMFPKRGRLFLNLPKKERPVNKTPVFLIDRREPDLLREIERLENRLKNRKTAR
jgi:U32 family peptidase